MTKARLNIAGTASPKVSFYFWIFIIWSAIGGTFAAVSLTSFHPLVVTIAFFFVGWLQYVLVQAMHEAVHQFFLKKNFESWVVACLTTYPVGLTRNYLIIHLRHHWNFGDAKQDPDSSGYVDPPRTKIEFVISLLRVGLVLPALFQFFKQNASPQVADIRFSVLKYSGARELRNLCIVQVAILTLISVALGLGSYFALWILPILTVVKVLSIARIMAEHSTPKGVPILRSFETSPIRGALLGPFGFQHHGIHHVQMQVPFTQLKEKRNLLSKSVEERYKSETYAGCHSSYLIEWFAKLPFRANKENANGS